MPDCFVVAIVDDDEAVRQSTAGLLRRAGHIVRTYADGAEFLDADLSGDVGCILLDMILQRVDGLAVMLALREREVTTPILVLTGHGDVPLAVEAMRLGAFDFLEKPYPSAELRDAIQRACTAPRAQSDQAPDPQAKAKVATL